MVIMTSVPAAMNACIWRELEIQIVGTATGVFAEQKRYRHLFSTDVCGVSGGVRSGLMLIINLGAESELSVL